MKKTHGLVAFASLVLIGSAGTAIADGFYLGVGVGYSSMESAEGGAGSTSELDTAVLGLTGGYRWDLSTGFAAAEVDTDWSFGGEFEFGGVSCADGVADAPYYCEHQATVRLRGLYGAPVGAGWEAFGALGYGFVFGEGAISPGGVTDSGVSGGLTAGLGAQRDLGGGKLRLEAIYDNFTNVIEEPGGTFEPEFEAASFKASYIFNF